METLVVLSIGMSMTLGCFALGFGIFVMKSEGARTVRVQNSTDADHV